jgi:hypothetical protein
VLKDQLKTDEQKDREVLLKQEIKQAVFPKSV